MKGMEMMLDSLFKMAGVNKDEVIQQFKNAQELLVSSCKNFDERLIALEKSQQENKDLLIKVINLLEHRK